MHSRALHVLALALTAVVRAGCDDKARWYSGLRYILKNCPLESRNPGSGQDELLEAFRRCVQRRAIDTLDNLFDEDVITVFDGIDLIRIRPNDENGTESKDTVASANELENESTSWSTIIWNRVTRVLRTHAFRIDIDRVFNAGSATGGRNSSQPTSDSDNAVQGRRHRHRHRHRHHRHLMPLMIMGVLLMGSVLVPMGFQFLAVLGGKALILAKMALILSSIQGLKKVATSGINYGLYHSPHGWHDRNHQILSEDEHQQIYMPPHH